MSIKKALAAVAAGLLLVALTPTVAHAAEGDSYYVTDQDFPPETQPYTPGWFTGGGSTGTIETTFDGLRLNGKYQILNADTPTTGLEELVDGYKVNVLNGQAWTQISLFFDDDDKFTTLRQPVSLVSNVDPDGEWTTSWQVFDLAAGSTNTLQDYLDRFDDNYTILGFGAFVDTGQTASIASIEWAGQTHVFTPGPQPIEGPPYIANTEELEALMALWGDEYEPTDLGEREHTDGSGEDLALTIQWTENDRFVEVYLFSEAQTLGVFARNGVQVPFTIPAAVLDELEDGLHHILVRGQASGWEEVWTFTYTLNAAPAGGSGGSGGSGNSGSGTGGLAGTGAEIDPVLVAAGGVLLLAGVVAVVATRRARARMS